MKRANQNLSLSKLVLTVLILLSITMQAVAQEGTPNGPSRNQNPNGQRNNADVQVWVGVDVLPGGITGQDNAANSPTASEQNQNSQFAGVWNTEAIPGLVLTLQLDGDFSLGTSVNLERRCSAGVERGSWLASADTNELLFHIKTDTNGHCGFSDLESTMVVVKTETGLALLTNDPTAAEQQIPLIRAEP